MDFDDMPWWKQTLFGTGGVLACIVAIGSVISLLRHPSWNSAVLLLAVLATWIVVSVSKKYWLKILFVTAFGILVIYTITGVILGNIDRTELSGFGWGTGVGP